VDLSTFQMLLYFLITSSIISHAYKYVLACEKSTGLKTTMHRFTIYSKRMISIAGKCNSWSQQNLAMC
jgi:hypothetical protein